MDQKRRFLLKGMLASGAGGALMGGSGLAQAALNLNRVQVLPTLLLTSDAAIERSFAAGVKAALPETADLKLLRVQDFDALTEVSRVLEGGRGIRLIGMIDDASAELLVAQARRAGASMSWLGQHASELTQTRHQVIHGSKAQSAVLALGEQLKGSAAGFALQSAQPYSADRDLELSVHRSGPASSQWAAHLGHALAAPGAMVDANTLPARYERLEGRFVSFVIEV